MTATAESAPPEGVQFASIDGSRSSQRAGKAIFADAVRAVDADLAGRIDRTKAWRKEYIDQVREVVISGATSAKNASRIAADGLDSVQRHLTFVTGGNDVALRDAMRSGDPDRFHTAIIEGTGQSARELAVPRDGELLRGDALLRRLERWEADGTIEPSAREALTLVVRNPEWLDLHDLHFATLGTVSEMGPFEALCGWGANVIAFDLPRRHLWERIVATARAGSGRVHAVATRPVTSDNVVDGAGVDLMTDTPDVRAWLAAFEHPFTLGNYVYADGTNFVRLAVSVDAMIAELVASRPDVSLAYLATPTDVFAVPEDAVSGARTNTKRSLPATVLRTLSASNLYRPNFQDVVEEEETGRIWGISDCLVPIQGANYALAKSLQRWRSTVAREEGTLSSANVAPATRTKSVVKNRMLAAAYRGARGFGVDIFAPETSSVLMAALLVHDLRNPDAPANPSTPIDHPFEVFAQGAVHGGIWRLPHEPRSVLPLALLIGLAKKR
ncbi:MAG: hypothetical protein ACRDKT_09535 [Actinomycetota bacterium]